MSETNRYGLDLMFRSNILDGERAASEALMAAGFVSGQPLAWTGSGYVKADPGDVIYIPLVSRDDLLNQSPKIEKTAQAGSPVMGVVGGTNIFRMEGGVSLTVRSLPFKATPSSGNWTVGDKLYIASDGLWDNQAAGVGDPFYGEVNAIEGDTDDATALVVIATSFPTTVY
jgi:hypothetical protein